MHAVLVDAGPLVAVLDVDDADHERCVDALRAIHGPLVTVWPALTEAMYLLGYSWDRQRALWEMIETDVLQLLTLDRQDAARMRTLMQQYRDQPMDLADAALVRAAERERIARIFTLDRRHFLVYRPRGLKRFTVIP